MKDKILVFVPMYNCAKQIVRVLEQFNGDIKNYISQIILVNNRSTDNGESAAIDKIIRNSRKLIPTTSLIN